MAFVIYNIKENEILFSRDRLGEKPFYYVEIDKRIYFGSEPKFIFSLMNKTLDLDKHKIMQFLVCGYRSIFKKKILFFKP